MLAFFNYVSINFFSRRKSVAFYFWKRKNDNCYYIEFILRIFSHRKTNFPDIPLSKILHFLKIPLYTENYLRVVYILDNSYTVSNKDIDTVEVLKICTRCLNVDTMRVYILLSLCRCWYLCCWLYFTGYSRFV